MKICSNKNSYTFDIEKLFQKNLLFNKLKKHDHNFKSDENIFFSGIDFIDQKLNGDINVTSPTGLKTLYDLSKINLAKTFWKELKV